MKSTARAAGGHTLGSAPRVSDRIRSLTGPAAGVAAGAAAGSPSGWHTPTAVGLFAAVLTATVAVLIAWWNRVHQLADRRYDRAERRQRAAQLRAEAELRERRVAFRTAWTTHYRRIDELLVDIGKVAYEAHRRRLHIDDPEAVELVRLRDAAEQYAGYAPGALPAALSAVAESIRAVHRHLLPAARELDSIGAVGRPSFGYHSLFTRAGDQTRAADRLSEVLKDARTALLREWGME